MMEYIRGILDVRHALFLLPTPKSVNSTTELNCLIILKMKKTKGVNWRKESNINLKIPKTTINV